MEWTEEQIEEAAKAAFQTWYLPASISWETNTEVSKKMWRNIVCAALKAADALEAADGPLPPPPAEEGRDR